MREFFGAAPVANVGALKSTDECIKALAASCRCWEAGEGATARCRCEGRQERRRRQDEEMGRRRKDLRDRLAAPQTARADGAADQVAQAAVAEDAPVLKKLETSAQEVIRSFKKCDQNQGQVEGIAEQAVMAPAQCSSPLEQQRGWLATRSRTSQGTAIQRRVYVMEGADRGDQGGQGV
jgi:hypothetical protein